MITLVIIGVIAAITVPTVMNKINEQQTVSAVKATYSKLAQAIQKAQVDNGFTKTWTFTNSEEIFNIVKPNLQLMKVCGYETGCFPDVNYLNLNNSNFGNIDNMTEQYKFILNNGVPVVFYYLGSGSVNIWFDINGNKGPNKFGKDAFILTIRMDTGKIIPAVTQKRGSRCFLDEKGWDCSKWIIEHENTQYLATAPAGAPAADDPPPQPEEPEEPETP